MWNWYKVEVAPRRSPESHKKAEQESQTKEVDFERVPVISREDLAVILVPKYIAAIPEEDGWGHPYEFRLNTKDANAIVVMAVRSAGKDGQLSGSHYSVGGFEPSEFDQDIPWMDGYFVRWPAEERERPLGPDSDLRVVRDQQPLDPARLAGRLVDVDDGAGEADVPLGDLEGGGGLEEEALEHLVDPHADHRLVGAGHADVGLQGGAAGEDPLVGGGDVGVGAEHGAHPAVEVEAHRLLLAGRLGVEVDQDHLVSSGRAARAARSAMWNGESRLLMKTRPSRLITATGMPAAVSPTWSPLPGLPAG